MRRHYEGDGEWDVFLQENDVNVFADVKMVMRREDIEWLEARARQLGVGVDLLVDSILRCHIRDAREAAVAGDFPPLMTDDELPVSDETPRAHGHYFRDVRHLDRVDVYRVLELFEVTDPCIQHAVKKLLVAGSRGSKGIYQDVAEAIASLERWQEMREEDPPY